MTATEKYLNKLISFEMTQNPGHIELSKAIEVFNEFSIAFEKECNEELEEEEKRLIARNYEVLRGRK